MATLAEVEALHVAARSVKYQNRDRSPQCAIERSYIHYRAPDRIRVTSFHCTPMAAPARSDLVQVGDKARRRGSVAADGTWDLTWTETELALKSPDDLPDLIERRVPLPSYVGYITAFRIPETTSITIQGTKRPATVLPVESQSYPKVLLPGIPPGHGGPVLHVTREGVRHRPSRIVTTGRLFIDLLTARPLRYVSTLAASLEDGTTLVLGRGHVCFRYDAVSDIALPAAWRGSEKA